MQLTTHRIRTDFPGYKPAMLRALNKCLKEGKSIGQPDETTTFDSLSTLVLGSYINHIKTLSPTRIIAQEQNSWSVDTLVIEGNEEEMKDVHKFCIIYKKTESQQEIVEVRDIEPIVDIIPRNKYNDPAYDWVKTGILNWMLKFKGLSRGKLALLALLEVPKNIWQKFEKIYFEDMLSIAKIAEEENVSFKECYLALT